MLKRFLIHIYHETFCDRKGYKYFNRDRMGESQQRQCSSCGKIQNRIKGTLWDSWE